MYTRLILQLMAALGRARRCVIGSIGRLGNTERCRSGRRWSPFARLVPCLACRTITVTPASIAQRLHRPVFPNRILWSVRLEFGIRVTPHRCFAGGRWRVCKGDERIGWFVVSTVPSFQYRYAHRVGHRGILLDPIVAPARVSLRGSLRRAIRWGPYPRRDGSYRRCWIFARKGLIAAIPGGEEEKEAAGSGTRRTLTACRCSTVRQRRFRTARRLVELAQLSVSFMRLRQYSPSRAEATFAA